MKHVYARDAILAIVRSSGFDDRAQALVHAASLRSDPTFDPALGAQVHLAAMELTADQARCDQAPLLTAPLPDSLQELCTQLAPLVTDFPQAMSQQVASLQQLCLLWPHASRDERAHLRLNWLGSLQQRRSPPGSFVSRETLREWQRDLPTVNDDRSACAAVLCDMLACEQGRDAYNCLSMYLGAQADLPTLAWTLGVLSERILLHHFDPHGDAVQSLIGTISCEQLVPYSRPETLVTLVSQLAHYIWWCARKNRSRNLQPSPEHDAWSLTRAVEAGDIYAAQRAARQALADRRRFWQQVTESLRLVLGLGHSSWTTALAAVVAVRYRGGERAVLSPDDAATVGAALASAKYRADHHSSRVLV